MPKGKIPILVGGTGFYIQAVTRDIDFTQAEQETLPQELEKLAERKREMNIFMRCLQVDPKSVQKIHANNVNV